MNLDAIMNPVDTFPPSLHREPSIITILPAELLMEIAEQLRATYSLASLASFNACCRQIHESTLPVLFRSLILVTWYMGREFEVEREVRVRKVVDIPTAWDHVR
jgi:hypothetical protein